MTTRKWAICLGTLLSLTACSGSTAPAPTAQTQASADPRSDGAENVRLVGYNDMQGRQGLVVSVGRVGSWKRAGVGWGWVGRGLHIW